MGFDLCNGALKIRESFWDSNSQHRSSLGNVRVHALTLFAFPLACEVTFECPSWPASLQPPCFGRKPKARVATLTMVITRPPFTYTTLSFLLSNLILEKNVFFHLMLKAINFSWVSFVVVIVIVVVVITSFCKPKLPISLTRLLNTHRRSTHWSTSKLIPSLLIFCFNFFVVLVPSLLVFCTNDQRNKLQDSLKKWRRYIFKKNLIYLLHAIIVKLTNVDCSGASSPTQSIVVCFISM